MLVLPTVHCALPWLQILPRRLPAVLLAVTVVCQLDHRQFDSGISLRLRRRACALAWLVQSRLLRDALGSTPDHHGYGCLGQYPLRDGPAAGRAAGAAGGAAGGR